MYRVKDCVEPSPVTHESMPNSKVSGGGARAGAGAGPGGGGGNDGAVVGKYCPAAQLITTSPMR